MGWVPTARGRDDVSRGFVFGAVRLPTPMAAEVRVRVGVRAPKRPSAAFLLRAGAKLTENDGKTFSNFSRCAKIEAPTRGLPFRAQSSRFRAPRRVKKNKLKKSTISRRRCAYGLDAAVERRRAAREPLIPYRPAFVFGSSENRREMGRSAPICDRIRERMDENLPGEFVTFS